MTRAMDRVRAPLTTLAACLALAAQAPALPNVTRLTPPSNLFRTGDAQPVVARFLLGQRFDLQATISPDAGQTIVRAWFVVGAVQREATLAPATVPGLPANTVVASSRAFSWLTTGVQNFSVWAEQSNGARVEAVGNFEVVGLTPGLARARNVIVLIGDGLGIAHRTAARLMLHGSAQGKTRGQLAMDLMPVTGMVMTASLNSIVTDSSPGSACYSSGNKGNNNQHGVFPDDTTDNFDNPRVEHMGEYLARTTGRALGLVTTSDVFDATPAAWATHTQNRGAGTGICDQYLDESATNGLRVLLGGGRKWYLPAATPGSARANGTDYVLPNDIVQGWGVPAGALDPQRDLIAAHQSAGWTYVASATELNAVGKVDRLLGLFALSNMNVALDKVNGRRGNPAVVNDHGFPDQPMLDEMTRKALEVLGRAPKGFVLMVEGASIDKQAHNMDTERWMLDTIEFDRAVGVCREFVAGSHEIGLPRQDTLMVVTADHECAGINIIGGSRVTHADLTVRANSGGGAGQLRTGVVGTYDAAGFPRYQIAPDGYPVTTDIDFRLLIGYAANADRYEDWVTNPQPLRDSQQPFNNVPPLNTYPTGPLNRDVAGNFLVTGQVPDVVAAHTASDIPVSAQGVGASLFSGVMDNTDVFFKVLQAVYGVNP